MAVSACWPIWNEVGGSDRSRLTPRAAVHDAFHQCPFCIGLWTISFRFFVSVLKNHRRENRMQCERLVAYRSATRFCNGKTPTIIRLRKLDNRLRVHKGGAMAEKVVTSAANPALKPNSLTVAESASVVTVALTAFQTFNRYANTKTGDAVLIDTPNVTNHHPL